MKQEGLEIYCSCGTLLGTIAMQYLGFPRRVYVLRCPQCNHFKEGYQRGYREGYNEGYEKAIRGAV